MWCLWHHVIILQLSAHISIEWVPPCLFMWATTLVLVRGDQDHFVLADSLEVLYGKKHCLQFQDIYM